MQSNGEIETAKKFKDFYDLFKSHKTITFLS